MDYFVQSYCSITTNILKRNGSEIFASDDANFTEFAKNAARHLELNYPKFFKMDSLSKLAMLASEMIIKDADQETALLFANRSSSLDTDVRFQKSISDAAQYFPSPAVFVYTLSNIGIGEISIKNQLHTENCFFIFDAFDATFMHAYANILLATGKASKVLCGWTEILGDQYHAFAYLVSPEGTIHHTEQAIKNLYDVIWKP